MAYSVNKVTLLGNLGRDAETNHTGGGFQVTKFSVATERSWKDKGSDEWKKESTWTNCVLWGKEKIVEKLKKGTKVYLEGRLSTRSYDNKEGHKVYVTEVIVEEIIPLENSKSSSVGAGESSFDAPF
jgi:single-strand DNA-binding protein